MTLALAAGANFAPAPALPAQELSPPLADNSLLIEEAYNQERGVVQHVLLFVREQRTGSWTLGFTQEWPAWSSRHQVSFSIPLVHPPDPGLAAAFGDVLLHYRYQLISGTVAVAPRLTLLVPTGSAAHSATAHVLGVQAAVPVSFKLSTRLSAHLNVGASTLPSVSQFDGFTGASLVYFLQPRLNLLLEALAVTSRGSDGGWSHGTVTVAGVRWGHDLPGGVQVVPGFGWGFGTGLRRDAGGPIAYLSLEHRFR
jgi:hypothetical protein